MNFPTLSLTESLDIRLRKTLDPNVPEDTGYVCLYLVLFHVFHNRCKLSFKTLCNETKPSISKSRLLHPKSGSNRFYTPLEGAAEHCRHTKNKEASEPHLLGLLSSPPLRPLPGPLSEAVNTHWASKGNVEYIYDAGLPGKIQRVTFEATFRTVFCHHFWKKWRPLSAGRAAEEAERGRMRRHRRFHFRGQRHRLSRGLAVWHQQHSHSGQDRLHLHTTTSVSMYRVYKSVVHPHGPCLKVHLRLFVSTCPYNKLASICPSTITLI